MDHPTEQKMERRILPPWFRPLLSISVLLHLYVAYSRLSAHFDLRTLTESAVKLAGLACMFGVLWISSGTLPVPPDRLRWAWILGGASLALALVTLFFFS